jgi:hypothetical protein
MATQEEEDVVRPPAPVQQGTEAQPQQSQGSDVAGAWRDWLTNPENRASLMQFGVSMLQPVGVGQSQAGHFGQALGQAGEAATRVRAEDLAKRKAESEIQYKEERGNLAAERANVAGQNLQLQQEKLELQRLLGHSAQAEKLMKDYEDAKILNKNLKLEDFLRNRQQTIRAIQAQSGIGAGTGDVTAAATPSGRTKVVGGKTYVERNGKWYAQP